MNNIFQPTLNRIAPLIGLVLCAIAVAFVHREMSAFHWKEIRAAIAGIPVDIFGVMIGLVLLNYLILGFHDLLGLEYAGEKLPHRRVLLTAFLDNAIGNNLGQAAIDGGSLRYKFYARWGMPEASIFKVTLFCAAAYVIGSLTLITGGYAYFSSGVEEFLQGLPQGFVQIIVALGAALLAAWWACVLFYRKPLTVKGFSIDPPKPVLALRQSLLAVLDLALASLVLYLPLCHAASMPYGVFVVFYIAARLAGVISRLPGGIGVFEACFLFMASHQYAASHVLAALIAYRAVYHFMPLVLAGIGLALHNILKGERTRNAINAIGGDISGIIPHVFAALLFACGASLLFAGATPDRADRLLWLQDIMPLPLIEASHLIGSMIGIGLLILARAVQQRMDSAYYATIILLAIGMAASLTKGWDVEETIVLGGMLALFIAARKSFYRKSALVALDYPPQWMFLFLLVVGLSVGLGVFSYKHIAYTNELWWKFSLEGDAPRFLRSLVAIFVAACGFVFYRFLTRRCVRLDLPDAAMLEKARAVAGQSSGTQPHLVLTGDKYLLWSDSGKSFIMYGVTRKIWIAMGDPAGDAAEFEDLAWKFRELADRHGAQVAFYQVSTLHLPLYIDLGLALVKLGEEARVPLLDFGLEGKKRQKLRQSYSKHERESGLTFEVVPSAATPAIIAELRGISDRWMEGKKAREKGFSVGFFADAYLCSCDIAVLKKDGRILAFANLWQTANKSELGIDLMRFSPDAPDGVMAHLTVCLMFWGKEQGYQWFTLGMSPLSGLESRPLASLWNKIGGTIYRSGGDFYNFEGLHQYKSKFAPTWQPRYLASPVGNHQVATALVAVTSLISGGIGGTLKK